MIWKDDFNFIDTCAPFSLVLALFCHVSDFKVFMFGGDVRTVCMGDGVGTGVIGLVFLSREVDMTNTFENKLFVWQLLQLIIAVLTISALWLWDTRISFPDHPTGTEAAREADTRLFGLYTGVLSRVTSHFTSSMMTVMVHHVLRAVRSWREQWVEFILRF